MSTLVPIIDGAPVGPEQFEALDEEVKADIETRREALQQEINIFLRQVRDINKASRERIEELNRGVGQFVVGGKIEGIKEQYAGLPDVIA